MPPNGPAAVIAVLISALPIMGYGLTAYGRSEGEGAGYGDDGINSGLRDVLCQPQGSALAQKESRTDAKMKNERLWRGTKRGIAGWTAKNKDCLLNDIILHYMKGGGNTEEYCAKRLLIWMQTICKGRRTHKRQAE